MSAIITTLTGSGKNISTEILLCSYTSVGDQVVVMQPRLLNLLNTAALITFRLEQTSATHTVLADQVDMETRAKTVITNTVYGSRWLGPVALKDGEILNLYCQSSNADTNTSYSVDVINVLAGDPWDTETSTLTGEDTIGKALARLVTLGRPGSD